MRISSFDGRGNNPGVWQGRAAHLLEAAEPLADKAGFGPGRSMSIEPRIMLMPVALMLRAFAVECLLKARWLKTPGARLAKEGSWVPIPGINNHDLVGLARTTRFRLSTAQISVLNRLTHFSVWGRYPIESHWSKHQGRSFWESADERTFGQIVERLKS